MPGQLRISQPGRAVPFVPGSTAVIEIPRIYDIESLYLHISGTVTYGASANAADEVQYAAPRLIERLELVANGSMTIASVPGWKLNIATERYFPSHAELYSFPDPAVSATHTINAAYVLDQMIFDGVRPKDGNLRSRGFDYLELKVTFADWSKIYTNSRSYPVSHTLNLSSQLAQTVEQDWAATKPSILVRRSYQTIDASAANQSRIIRLPAGNEIRRIDILSLTSAGAWGSDNLVNSVTVRNGIDVRYIGTALQTRNITRMQRQSAGNFPGLLHIDFGAQGMGGAMASNNWSVPTPAEPEIVIDHSTGGAGATITVVITEYLRLV